MTIDSLTVGALLGIAAVWAAAMVVVLALCRTAAAGDRVVVDRESPATARVESETPIPFARSEPAKRKRKRARTTGARKPIAPSASTTRASAPQPRAPLPRHATPERTTSPRPTGWTPG
jgi:hypothetical protein